MPREISDFLERRDDGSCGSNAVLPDEATGTEPDFELRGDGGGVGAAADAGGGACARGCGRGGPLAVAGRAQAHSRHEAHHLLPGASRMDSHRPRRARRPHPGPSHRLDVFIR
jgi:hypothetical protein